MTTLLTLRPVAAADWPAVSGAFQDLTYEQTLTYSRAAAARIGAKSEYVAVEDGAGKVVAAACLRIKLVPGLGRGIAWVAAGPLMHRLDEDPPDPGTVASILEGLRKHVTKAGHVLRMRMPALPGQDIAALDGLAERAGYQRTDRSAVYRSIAIDLSQDQEALMAGLHGKWRNPLRNALKAGLKLESGPITELSERFHALYVQVQQAKGFQPDIPPDFYYSLEGQDFDHDVIIARADGTDQGAMTLGRAGRSAIYLFGATTETGRRLNAGHFLMWQAMLWAKERGSQWLDLGGIDDTANPSVARFKHRTGGSEIIAPGPYEARPKGASAALILGAEAAHSWLKARR